uniref:MORN repeat-containing protein 5 n=1 Tax=Noctiluca scintillans TaxID=2966 RepID=A0A7S1ANA3_NOCSC
MGAEGGKIACCASDDITKRCTADVQNNDFLNGVPACPGFDRKTRLETREEVQENTHLSQWTVYGDESKYKGQMLHGKRHGRGVGLTASGQQYEGEWRDDQRHGHGKQSWKDGRLYEGQFKDGKFHGHGRMEWHTQRGMMVFEGQYVEDIKQGVGVYTWPDGRLYDGEWVQGKRSGRAVYVNSHGERKLSTWADDKLQRWTDASDDEPQRRQWKDDKLERWSATVLDPRGLTK